MKSEIKKGHNVVGKVEPGGEVKRQIILCGHHDSARVCNFLEKNQKLYAFRLILPVIFYSALIIFTVLFILFDASALQWKEFIISAKIISFAGYFFILPMFFYHSRKVSFGAGDNLICSVMSAKIPEIIKNAHGQLKHTRIIFLSTDGEEIGQKGAQAYIRKHKNELKDTKTYVFNMDSIYTVQDLALLKTEINGTKKLNMRLIEETSELSEKIGHRIKTKPIPFIGGGTDAGQFARAGIDAVSLIGISTDLVRKNLTNHTSKDTLEYIDPEAIEIALNMAINFIIEKDR